MKDPLLKTILLERGWSYVFFGELLGVSDATVCRWIKGINWPDEPQAKAIERLLCRKIDDLLPKRKPSRRITRKSKTAHTKIIK